MKVFRLFNINIDFTKKNLLLFNKENRTIIIQFILGVFFIGLGIWFVKHEKSEIFQIKNTINNANLLWVYAGILTAIAYFVLQGLLYVASFSAINAKINLKDGIILFLKRNFISVFLPAGGFSSLFFFSKTIEEKGNTKIKIHLASGIYAFVGILSVVLVAFPVFIFALLNGTIGASNWYALVVIIALKIGLILLYRSIIKKGKLYALLIKWYPKSEPFFDDLENHKIDVRKFLAHYKESDKFLFSAFSQYNVSHTLDFFHKNGMDGFCLR